MYDPSTEIMHPLAAPIGLNPSGGKTFYVSNLSSDSKSDSNEGTDPQYPLATITQALSLCTQRKNDYIFVQDSYQQESGTVTMNIRNVHLIGLGPGGFMGTRALLDGNGAAAITTSTDGGSFELAGFRLGSTGGSDPGILQSAIVWTCHVHHCSFGEVIPCNYGIFGEAQGKDLHFWTIDHCYFGQLITVDCIRDHTASRALILYNIMRQYDGIGYHVEQGTVGVVAGNMFFNAQGASEGWAIDLGGSSNGGMIDDNHAMEDGADSANNPYKDTTSGGTPNQANAWGLNYKGITAVYPA